MMRILFVCMGNICRSPAAEGVMQHLLDAAKLSDKVQVDSAGTIGLHAGNPSDARMRRSAQKRGVSLSHKARQVRASDLEDFDLILAMDKENLRDIKNLETASRHAKKVRLFCDFCTEHDHTEVPDPYYGGDTGFELVLDLLEDGCAEILKQVETGKLLVS